MQERQSRSRSTDGAGDRDDDPRSTTRRESTPRRTIRDDGRTIDHDALRRALEASGLALEAHDVDDEATDRGQVLYDRWSRHPRIYAAVMNLAAPLFEDAFDALDAQPGEIVCDLGCGNGRNFERLADAVDATDDERAAPDDATDDEQADADDATDDEQADADDATDDERAAPDDATDDEQAGAVVGVDYSPGMIASARERVHSEGWHHVHVARGDATDTVGPADTYDAVFTTFALHTMQDPRAVLENVRDALAPDGRVVALDGGGLRKPGTRWLNPVFERALARTVDHQVGVDTLAVARDVFDDVTVKSTYDAGSGYVFVAEQD